VGTPTIPYFAADSELERRLITCARNQNASTISEPEDEEDDVCFIIHSHGDCWIVHGDGPF
jgi:hypothetical protein